MGEVAKLLRSALLGLPLSFRTQHPDLPTIAQNGSDEQRYGIRRCRSRLAYMGASLSKLAERERLGRRPLGLLPTLSSARRPGRYAARSRRSSCVLTEAFGVVNHFFASRSEKLVATPHLGRCFLPFHLYGVYWKAA